MVITERTDHLDRLSGLLEPYVPQYAGRLHRLHDMKKEVVIYDYLDDKVHMSLKMFGKRQRGYRAIGYDIKERGDAEVSAGKLDFDE